MTRTALLGSDEDENDKPSEEESLDDIINRYAEANRR